jgi:hypothetical protein
VASGERDWAIHPAGVEQPTDSRRNSRYCGRRRCTIRCSFRCFPFAGPVAPPQVDRWPIVRGAGGPDGDAEGERRVIPGIWARAPGPVVTENSSLRVGKAELEGKLWSHAEVFPGSAEPSRGRRADAVTADHSAIGVQEHPDVALGVRPHQTGPSGRRPKIHRVAPPFGLRESADHRYRLGPGHPFLDPIHVGPPDTRPGRVWASQMDGEEQEAEQPGGPASDDWTARHTGILTAPPIPGNREPPGESVHLRTNLRKALRQNGKLRRNALR